MNRIFLIISLLFCVCCSRAQDLITRNDGVHIYCRIIKVDSVKIIYKTPQVRDDQAIDRSLVVSYYQSASAARPIEQVAKKSEETSDVFLLKFRLGSCKPLGEFASQDLSSEKSGLAKGGIATEVTAIIKVHRVLGITFAYKYQSNPFNMDALCNELRAQVPNAELQCQAEDWRMRGLFAGLHLCVPLGQPEGLWITADAGGGIPKFLYPNGKVIVNPSSNPLTVNFTSEMISSPAFSGGLGLRYNVSKNIAFDLNVDFYSAKPVFRVVTTNSAGYYESSSYTQIYQTVNICGGLVICFQKSK